MKKLIDKLRVIKKLKNVFIENKVVHLQSLNIKASDNILILSPHPDDESIGCGGLILNFSKQCKVICITDGRYGDPNLSINKVIEIRKKEFINAMNFAGVENYEFLNVEDGNLLNDFYKFSKINFYDYSYVFIPNILDQHSDHIAVGIHLLKFLKNLRINKNFKICMYEVWNALALPNYYIDISNFYTKKKKLISFYESQIKYINYSDRILALNYYRGMSVEKEYVEVYTCIDSNEFIKIME